MYTWLPEKQFRVFFIVMAAVVVAYVLRSGLYFVVAYWGHTFGIRVEADIRRDLYHHMQELGFDFYDRNRTGQLMSRLTSDLFEVTELAHHGPEDLFISVVTIVGALIVMFCIRWELALVLLVIAAGAAAGGSAPPQADERRLPRRQAEDRQPSTPPSSPACPASAPPRPSPTRTPSRSGSTRPTRCSRPPSAASTRRWASSPPSWSFSPTSCRWR